jgi:hypothetical protein
VVGRPSIARVRSVPDDWKAEPGDHLTELFVGLEARSVGTGSFGRFDRSPQAVHHRRAELEKPAAASRRPLGQYVVDNRALRNAYGIGQPTDSRHRIDMGIQSYVRLEIRIRIVRSPWSIPIDQFDTPRCFYHRLRLTVAP